MLQNIIQTWEAYYIQQYAFFAYFLVYIEKWQKSVKYTLFRFLRIPSLFVANTNVCHS